MIVWGWKTPSAALYAITERKGPYRWFGITFRRCFIGFMWSSEP